MFFLLDNAHPTSYLVGCIIQKRWVHTCWKNYCQGFDTGNGKHGRYSHDQEEEKGHKADN